MNLRKMLPLAFVAMAVGVAAGAESNSIFAFADTRESLIWRSLPGGEVSLPVSYPAGADSAKLTVSGAGGGYSYVRDGITADSVTVKLPAASTPGDEDVYVFTLSFYSGETEVGAPMTARLGGVSGYSASSTAASRCILPEGSAKWRRTGVTAIAPVLAGQSVEADGAAAGEYLAGSAGWVALGPYTPGATASLTLSGDGGTSVEINCQPRSKFALKVR